MVVPPSKNKGGRPRKVKCSECGKRCITKTGVCCDCRLAGDKARFLKSYLQEGTLGEACKACQFERRTVYTWIEDDEAFHQLYSEAQANRRDFLISRLYKAAKGELGIIHEVITSKRNGEITERDIPLQLASTEEVAIFGFLKATDHNQDEHDRMVFTEKNQVELTGKGGEALMKPTVIVDTEKAKQLTEAILSGQGT